MNSENCMKNPDPENRSDLNIASIIAIMTASFYVCWTPYAVRCILKMFGVTFSAFLSHLTLLIAKLGIIANPLIYIYNNKEVFQYLML